MIVKIPRKLEGLIEVIEFNLVRWIVLFGGRSSGKSHNGLTALIIVSMKKPLLIVCCRDTEKSIKNSIHRLIKNKIRDLGVYHRWVITDERIHCPLTGTEFVFIGLISDPEKIRSFEGADICIVEESAKTPKHVWKVLIPTIRKENSIVMTMYNPDWIDDDTHNRYVTNSHLLEEEGLYIRHINYLDNPFCSKETIAEANRCKKLDQGLYEHIWLGHPNTHSRQQIFNGAYEVEHFDINDFAANNNKNSKDYKGKANVYFGFSFGYSEKPTAGVRVIEYDNCLYIDQCVGGVGLEIDEMSEEAKRLEVPKSALFNVDDHIRVTPKLPATLKHIRNKSNLFMSEAESWEGDVISGIIFLRGEYRKIIIHPRCEEVIQNMNGYWWERDAKEDKILSEPIDMYNEYINAIRYALYKRIKGAI